MPAERYRQEQGWRQAGSHVRVEAQEIVGEANNQFVEPTMQPRADRDGDGVGRHTEADHAGAQGCFIADAAAEAGVGPR